MLGQDNYAKPRPLHPAVGVAGVLLSWLWNFLSLAENDAGSRLERSFALTVPTHAQIIFQAAFRSMQSLNLADSVERLPS